MSRRAVPLPGLFALFVLCAPSDSLAQRWQNNTPNTAVVKVDCNASVVILPYDLRPPGSRTLLFSRTRSDGLEVRSYRQFTGEFRFDITKGRCRTPPGMGPAGRACASTFREYGLRTFVIRPGSRRRTSGRITFDRNAQHCWLHTRVQAVVRGWATGNRPGTLFRSTGLLGNNGQLYLRGGQYGADFRSRRDFAQYELRTRFSRFDWNNNYSSWFPRGRLLRFQIRLSRSARGATVRIRP